MKVWGEKSTPPLVGRSFQGQQLVKPDAIHQSHWAVDLSIVQLHWKQGKVMAYTALHEADQMKFQSNVYLRSVLHAFYRPVQSAKVCFSFGSYEGVWASAVHNGVAILITKNPRSSTRMVGTNPWWSYITFQTTTRWLDPSNRLLFCHHLSLNIFRVSRKIQGLLPQRRFLKGSSCNGGGRNHLIFKNQHISSLP